ncbi:MFS transporter [Bacillus sonorensis]|uniref:MFS-type transporter YdeG n=2 Tax=Bacillus sonorensis TaxID=119858 RepID=A0ABN5AMU5_9BACI|nr:MULTISPECIES: MFS transporter [Bacillus]TWK75209.1 Riboflavin transporter RfnT [Bacillus paralicheniformis]ASB90924.1 putative MFS-type transporter YdeG [Bacillus sonorensis]EME74105.1 putative permease [Bacillus sonorensis L12]MCY8027465.1 MFS transporter [Bacillus sonorensis]MCY8272983.1 MFS transporter [Bacillus sonorensis]
MLQKDSAKSLDFQTASLQSCIRSPEKQKMLYKRTLFVVSISQIFGGAGLAAGVTVGALIAQKMLGTDAYAGVPTALFTLGSAGAALFVGRLSQRYGRRTGLSAGFMIGGLGAIGVIIAAIINSIFLLFASLLIYGAGTATNLQARYAGTDLANRKQRATAVSVTMVMTTFGAVAGPNLVNVTGDFALSIGVPSLAGPFILAAAAYILAGVVLFIMLRPDPLVIARTIEATNQEPSDKDHLATTEHTENKKGIIVGATIMVLTQIVMVAIMTMTPVHMRHHGHGLGAVGLVIGFHIGAMYLPSLVTGVLVDKLGRPATAVASGITLLLAGLIAAFAPGDSMVLIVIALSLLGLGWNLGLISGTALIVDSTETATRAKTQGTVDVLIALSGAAGGALSGMIVAGSSYLTLSFTGGIVSLLLIPVMIWSRGGKK